MKKIALIDYDMSVRGGVEQVTASLASALADFYEVHLLSLCQTGTLAYELDKRVVYTPMLDKELRLREMQRTLRPRLTAYFKEHGIDTAIVQGNYPGFIVSPVRLGSRVKLIFCDHGALMNQWDRRDIVVIRLISSLLCHKTVTLTQQSRSDYQKKFHLSGRKVCCIPNWVDLGNGRSEAFDESSRRIVSAGRFGKEKGFDLLVEAFAPVAKKHPDWSLDLFGDGEMMPAVRELVAKYGLEQQVNLLGMRRDLAQRYRDYSMYVLPSYREGMPLVLLEAKANRLPIISFDIMTGPREIVRDGVDGILVKPYDLKALGDAMCTLIENDALRCKLAKRSHENLDKFSKQTILQQWRDLIEGK